MNNTLTSGALQGIISGKTIEKPVLQVLSSKKISSSGTSERYRLLLSDGQVTYSSVMLAVQLNPMMESEIDSLAVVRVDKYLCNTIQNDKKVIIILDLTVITRGAEVGQKLGNPQPYRPTEASGAAPASNGTPAISNPAPVTPVKVPTPAAATLTNRSPMVNGTVAGKGGQATTPGGTSRIHAIANLTPYQNRWKIRARVSCKSAIRNWSNSRGEGKLFNMTVIDESGEIRITAFNDAVDKFYKFIEVNKVYYISRANLKTANKQYSNVNNNYEMTLNPDSVIELCTDESDLPTWSFDFKKLKDLAQVEPASIIDVIGVVHQVGDLATIVGRQSNKEFSKRELQIADQSGMSVRLTIWGSEAESFEGSKYPVVAVKGCKVSDWGGRSLSVLSTSQLLCNPDIKEAHFLRGWYDREGSALDFSTFQSDGSAGGGGNSSNWKTFGQAKTDKLGVDKPDYYTTKAMVMFIRKENCMYMACPSDNCNKKLVDQGNGLYRCEKCNQEFSNFKWRMILLVSLIDSTNSIWATCFQESAESLLGITADELGNLRETDEVKFDDVFDEAAFKPYIFKLRAKMETYNDETRLKTICMKATPIDWREYGQHLLSEIKKLSADSA